MQVQNTREAEMTQPPKHEVARSTAGWYWCGINSRVEKIKIKNLELSYE